MKSSFQIFFALLSFFAYQPATLQSSAQPLRSVLDYNQLDSDPDIFQFQIGGVLEGKLGSRLFNRGGPIRQPRLIGVAIPDIEAQKKLKGSWPDLLRDSHYAAFDHEKTELVDYRELVSLIKQQVFKQPLVLKDDSGSLGDGVIFFEALSGSEIEITLSATEPERLLLFGSLFEKQGVSQKSVKTTGDTLKIKVDLTDRNSSELIYQIILGNLLSAQGMVDLLVLEEKIINLVQINGGAFETRHRFIANFNGEIDRIVNETHPYILEYDDYDMSDYGSFARIGSSPYYSNVTSREKAKTVFFPDFYKKLLQANKLPVESWKELSANTDRLIRDQWVHITNQIPSDRLPKKPRWIAAEIDLMWVHNSGAGLPQPQLIEMSTWSASIHLPNASCAEQLKDLE